MVFNFGINDLENMSKIGGKRTVLYSTWLGVLRRSTDKDYKKTRPTYKNVKCSDDWLFFSKFTNDLVNMQNYDKLCDEGWVLDKDILSDKHNKIYSKETCCIVPKEVNSLLTVRDSKRSEFGIGVFKTKTNKYRSSISINGKSKNLGTYNTAEEAKKVYIAAKKDYVLSVLNRYEGYFSEKIISSIVQKVSEL